MDHSIETPRGAIRLRFAERKDAKQLRALRLEALSMHPEAFSQDYETAAGQTDEMWVERLTNEPAQGAGIICVAEACDELIGMCALYRFKSEKTKHTGEIWGVYVKSEWRGIHVGEQLIRLCLTWGKERGVLQAEIGVISDNAAALRCYLRCGFRVFGVEPKAILLNGIFHDELLMTMEL